MSRRCLICANLNPCHRHSGDDQDNELRRNMRAIREIEAASADTLPKGQDAQQGLAGTESEESDDA